MWINVDPGSGVPIYVQIYEEVREAINSGFLGPGDSLPSVRDLSMKLGISPNTAARAYTELERDGFIKSRQGSGTYISLEAKEVSQRKQLRALKEDISDIVQRGYNLGLGEQQLIDLFIGCIRKEKKDGPARS